MSIEELKKAHDGKSFCLEHEDKEGFSKAIAFIAGLVKDTVDYMEAVEIKLKTTRTPAKAVGVRVLAAAPLKREVVDRYWGLEANVGVCFGGCGKQMVYDDVHLAHWRPRGELNEANGFVAKTAQVIWLLYHILFCSIPNSPSCIVHPFLHCATHLALYSSWGRWC